MTSPPLLPPVPGERYEGEWQDGQESGTATFVTKDGSTYYGTWLAGQMHGKCVYRPAAGDGARCVLAAPRCPELLPSVPRVLACPDVAGRPTGSGTASLFYLMQAR